MGDGLHWEGLPPNMGDICENMCFGNGRKRNLFLLSNFTASVRPPNLHGSMCNECLCLYIPILLYVLVKNGILYIPGVAGLGRPILYIGVGGSPSKAIAHVY